MESVGRERLSQAYLNSKASRTMLRRPACVSPLMITGLREARQSWVGGSERCQILAGADAPLTRLGRQATIYARDQNARGSEAA